jgi:hypothetical protein
LPEALLQQHQQWLGVQGLTESMVLSL